MKKAVGFLLAVGLCLGMVFSVMASASLPAGTAGYDYVSYRVQQKPGFTSYELYTYMSCAFESNSNYGLYYYTSASGYGKYYLVSDKNFAVAFKNSNSDIIWDPGSYSFYADNIDGLYGYWFGSARDYEYDSSIAVKVDGASSSTDIINYVNGNGFPEKPSSQETVYDSTIPAPENLTYISTKQLSQKLTWTNKLVDSYSVRVSANGRYNDQLTGKPEWHDYNLMIASDGSDGADAGVPASSGGITFSAVDMFQLIGDKYGTVSIKAFEPTEFRVQFYAYVEGVMQVGPVGVVRINKNSAGLWVGSTATVEYPADVGDLGSSGGLYPSGDAWTSDGQGFTDMDKDGNITGSGTVGDDESYVPVGSGPVSLGDFLKDMVNSLLNIPTVLSQLFNSIINAMSGMGELPALVASFFSFLPAEVVALISLGIIITIVLRIFGR